MKNDKIFNGFPRKNPYFREIVKSNSVFFDPVIKHPGPDRSSPLNRAKINPTNKEIARDRPAWGHTQTWYKQCKKNVQTMK